MGVRITGLGIAVPERIMTNFDLERFVDTSNEWIMERTGIRERRIADSKTATSDLSILAGFEALRRADTKPDELDAIIVCTATPDMFFPSTGCLVQRGLEASRAMSFDLSAGCTGFLYGLGVGEGMIRNGMKKILVIGAETLSKFMDFTDRATCVIFGDGAGAVVLENDDGDAGMIGSYFTADGSLGELLYMPAGGTRMPATKKTVSDRLHYIKMAGNEVFKYAVRSMAQASLEAIKRAGVSPDEIALFIPHQANTRIIEATRRRLNLPKEKVYVNIDRYGNTSAASIPIALYEAVESGVISEGDIILMVAFGAGFTWGGVVMRW
ncbi:MAG TPA: ketoacyl-ACP synthase III [bacterium (Candidatus Stahlbacteria)]|nr:ketoacyl-ACP synthase III [Candidatus Stahlbacteria bacterium]